MLKSYREQKGVSLQEIEDATKIRGKYLEAIENGQMDILPDEVYVLGFVRSYIKYLGIPDENAIIEQYKNYYKQNRGQNVDLESRLTPIDVKEVNRRNPQKEPQHLGKRPLKTRERSFGTRYIWVVLIVVIIAAVAALYVLGNREKTPPVTPGDLPAYQEPMIEPPPVIDPEPDEDEPTVDDFDGVKVLVTVVEGSCWVGVTTDDTYTEQTMTVGTTKEFTAEKYISIKYGNAGAVKVEYNGQIVNPLGRRGEVMKIEYVKE